MKMKGKKIVVGTTRFEMTRKPYEDASGFHIDAASDSGLRLTLTGKTLDQLGNLIDSRDQKRKNRE